MRVLMLHGYTQCASTFSKKLGALRKAAKQAGIELLFLDGPHDVPAATENSASLSQYDADASLDEPHKAWWFARENQDGSKTYRLFDETMRYLRDYMDRQPRIDGVMGFSQGAALAAVLAIVLRHPDLHSAFADSKLTPLKFVVIVGGFPVIDPDLAMFWSRGLAETPSLHIQGRGDHIVGEERSGPLITAFKEPRVEYHDGGHFVPTNTPWRTFIVNYMRSFDGSGPREVPSPSAPRL